MEMASNVTARAYSRCWALAKTVQRYIGCPNWPISNETCSDNEIVSGRRDEVSPQFRDYSDHPHRH